MAKNDEVALAFVEGKKSGMTGSHMFYEYDVIYSYGYHFPIALKLEGGYVFNKSGYSMTTSRHKSIVRSKLNGYIVEMTTPELKAVMNKGYKKITDLVAEKLEPEVTPCL